MTNIYAAFANYDNDLRKHKSVAGMQKALENGGWPFKASLGYRKIFVKGVGATLEPDPFAGPIVDGASR